jgi:hypothetical protein
MSSDFHDDVGGFDELAEARLDAELAASEEAVREQLGGGLAELLSPPADLTSRTAAGVGDALLTRSTLAAAMDLLSVGWHTVRYLAGDPDPNSRKETNP